MNQGPRLAIMAWRNLWRQKRRTGLTLSSIAFGFVLAVLFTAMQDENWAQMIDTAARMGTGHITLQHVDAIDTPKLTLTVRHSDALEAMALADDGVERVTQRISGQTMVSAAHDSFGAFFVAFDPAAEDASTLEFIERVESGEMFANADDRGIILGVTLAENLGVDLGDRVVYRLTGRDGDVTADLGRLKGTVTTGAPSADAGLVLLPIGRVRTVLGYAPDESTLLAIFLKEPRECSDVAARLGAQVDNDVSALTWEEVRPELSALVAMKVGSARFMEFIIMLLVAAGIFNTLFISVMERLREFGVMIAIGYSPGQLFRLIMWESTWLALTGLIAGGLVVWWPYTWLAEHGIDVSSMMGGNTEVAGVGFSMVLPVGIYPGNLIIIVVAVILSTLAAGLYPAWRAARVVPVESIKLV